MDHGLIEAAFSGNLVKIKQLLSQGEDIDIKEGAPLHRAAYSGHTDVVRYLLEQNADPNAGGARALVTAAYKGYLDIVKLLVEAGADINAEDENEVEGNVIISAAAGGSIPVLAYLLEQGAEILDWDASIVSEPVYEGHLPMVKYLESIGITRRDNRHVISSLAMGGHINMAIYLLSRGYNIKLDKYSHYLDNFAKTALDNDHPAMAKFLVEEAGGYPRHLLYPEYVSDTHRILQDYHTNYIEAISLIKREMGNLSSLIAKYY